MQTPTEVVNAQTERLPPGLRKFVRLLYTIFTWLALPASFLSAIGDLQLVMDIGRWILNHSGVLWGVVQAAALVSSNVIEAWRALTQPILELLRDILPFALPRWVFDIVILVVLPSVRAILAYRAMQRADSGFKAVTSFPGSLAFGHHKTPDGSESVAARHFRRERFALLSILCATTAFSVAALGIYLLDLTRQYGWWR